MPIIWTCIDSCIDALDELVIVHHDCTDDTPQILRSKQKQYPDKIKIYEYQPYVLLQRDTGWRFLMVPCKANHAGRKKKMQKNMRKTS